FSSRRRHTRFSRDWSSDVCSSDLVLNEDGDKIQIKSTEDISAVAFAGGANALSRGAAAANVTGSLREADVTSVNKANEMMVHVEIGRASCRGRGCVSWGVDASKRK